jgi:flagellar M-ring protein FliF
MRTFFNELLVQLKGIWNRLDGGQRLIVMAVMAATVVGLGAIVWYAGRPSYEAVFTASTADEINQMQQALSREGVGYQIADDGRTFKVERAKVGLANMALQKAGLTSAAEPQVGGASSIMDDAATKAYKLAQASVGLAERAIQGLEGVSWVKVTAFKPTRVTAFRDRDGENKPSATVALRLKPGTSFMDMARSAAAMVSSQLGIPLENVLVVSSTGNQRYRYDPDRDAGGGSSEFLTMQRNLAEERAQMAQEALDQMWPGKTTVRVTVELDPQYEVTSQKVLPSEPIIKTEKTSKDTTDSQQGKSDPNASPADAVANKNKQNNETKDRTYVTEIGERRTYKMVPDIKRLTVAVIYDKSLVKDGFSTEDLKKAVKSIVGWDKSRDSDDDFSLMIGDFQPIDFAAEIPTGPGFGDLALRWGPTIGQILGVIVVVMFLKGLFKRSGAKGIAQDPLVRASAKEENLTPDEQQKKMRRDIERSIASDPAALAKLLESWLTEQKA